MQRVDTKVTLMTRFSIKVSVLAATSLIALAAQAAPDAKPVYFASNCANCHGTDGRSATEIMPTLAGRDRQTLLASMRAYKSGERSGTIMPQLMQGYTDDELQQLADYFSAQK